MFDKVPLFLHTKQELSLNAALCTLLFNVFIYFILSCNELHVNVNNRNPCINDEAMRLIAQSNTIDEVLILRFCKTPPPSRTHILLM